MRVLVTGGAGYIGTPLCSRLCAAGHEVTCWDPGFFGYHFDEPPARLQIVERRVQTMGERDFDDARPDFVIHLSGLSNDPMANFAPRMNWAENTDATAHVGALAARREIPFLFASSASVYGYQPDAVLDESAPVEPIGHYSESKAAAERWLAEHHPRAILLRQATVMGWSPRMRFDLLTNGMTMTAWTRGEIRVLYGGREARPQVHVADLVEAYLAILHAKDFEPGVYNVGATNDNVAALASTIEQRISTGYGRTVRQIVTDEPRQHRSYALCSEKLRAATGWTPRFGIGETVDELCQGLARSEIDPGDPRTLNIAWMKLLYEAQGILERTGPIDASDAPRTP